MRLFSTLYEKVISWSTARRAPYWLATVSFSESSFFPIPPDVMLIPMGLAKPNSVWFFALITTIFSVLGGVFGYFLGLYGIKLLIPLIKSLGSYKKYLLVKSYFLKYGVWFVFVAGFTPIPYKLFTISAGALSMAFMPFVIASFIGRGARFFILAALMFYKGESIDKHLTKHIEWLSWLIILSIVIVFVIFKWLS